MKKLFLLYIFLFIFSCEKKDTIIDCEIDSIICDYTTTYPIQPFPKDYKKWGLNYPSYNVFFEVYEKDTVMTIVLLPMIDRLNKHDLKTGGFVNNKEDGFIMFDNNSPIVFFNTSIYNKELNNLLIKKTPDSLLYNTSYNEANVHPIFNNKEPVMYKIKKNERFEKINKKDSLYSIILRNYSFASFYFIE